MHQSPLKAYPGTGKTYGKAGSGAYRETHSETDSGAYRDTHTETYPGSHGGTYRKAYCGTYGNCQSHSVTNSITVSETIRQSGAFRNAHCHV